MKRILAWLLTILLLLSVSGCGMDSGYVDDENKTILPVVEADEPSQSDESFDEEEPEETIDEDGCYDSREDVALYLHTYGHLPNNYITKKEAENLGWSGGSLEPYAPGCCIGGSHFGNFEGILPTGHKYSECDIDTMGRKSRGAKRIIYSDDGLIFYTDDHYESFELLYGEADGWN